MGFLTPLGSVAKVSSANLEAISDEIGGWFARKTADQTIASSTAMTNDSELVVPVIANATYVMKAFISYRALAAAKIKIGWTGPAGATMDWSPVGLDTGVSGFVTGINRAVYTIANAPAVGEAGVAQSVSAGPEGMLITSATAGNLQFQWAQNTSNATGTVVKANSWVFLVRVQ